MLDLIISQKSKATITIDFKKLFLILIGKKRIYNKIFN